VSWINWLTDQLLSNTVYLILIAKITTKQLAEIVNYSLVNLAVQVQPLNIILQGHTTTTTM